MENGDALHDRGDVILRRYDDVVPVVAVHKSSLTTASEGTSPRPKPVPHGTSPVGAKIMKKIRKKMQPEEDESSRDKADDITFTVSFRKVSKHTKPKYFKMFETFSFS